MRRIEHVLADPDLRSWKGVVKRSFGGCLAGRCVDRKFPIPSESLPEYVLCMNYVGIISMHSSFIDPMFD